MGLVNTSILLLLMILQSLNCDDDSTTNKCVNKFVVVIDGSSSGTRMHIFEFESSTNYKTLKKNIKKKRPQILSQFSDLKRNWNKMRSMFTGFINETLSHIPEPCFRMTPIYVGITAGVRQLEQNMSERIVAEIIKILNETQFRFESDYVSILSTAKEGMYAWISTNFLMDKLQRSDTDPLDTYGILELGGGSTQFAFATKRPELFSQSEKRKIYNTWYHIFTGGYDYMGMDETRIKYFNAHSCYRTECRNQSITSQCLNSQTRGRYNFRNMNLLIAGKEISKDKRFCFCNGNGIKIIQSVKPIRHQFENMEFITLSTFYHVFTGAGILRKVKYELLETNIEDIITRAMNICDNPAMYGNPRSFKHLLCMDLSYIAALLHNGYKFRYYDKLLTIRKKHKIEIEWPLGYAVSIL